MKREGFEDNPKNISAIEDNEDLYCVVFNAGYNKDYEHERIRRVDLPIEAYKYVREFEEIKREKLNRLKIGSLDEMKKILKDYIYWFNNVRRSSKQKYTTPVKYKNRVLLNL